jgi:hypothetical protein
VIGKDDTTDTYQRSGAGLGRTKMTRPPFVAIATGPTPGHLDKPLNLLGARAIFVPIDTIGATLRRGRDSVLEAEVIVFDATDRTTETLTRTMILVAELRALPYSAKMPTGVPWNALPIVIVGYDHAIGSLCGIGSSHSNVHTCSVIDGWERCYRTMAEAALDFSIRIAQDMTLIGWRIKSENGRYYRDRRPNPLFGEIGATALYDPRDDIWFTQIPQADRRMYRVVAADNSAIDYDAEMFHDLTKKRDLPESRYQSFFEERPHYLEAARHEVIPQLDLFRADGQQHLRVDFAIVPIPEFATALPRLIEIKTPGMRLLSGRDPFRATWAHSAGKAIRQVRDYKETAEQMGSAALRRRYFSLHTSETSLTVIAGLRTRHNVVVLNRERKYVPDVEVLGYDDVETRLTQRHALPADEIAPTPIEPPKAIGTRRTRRRDVRTGTRKSA